MINSGPINGYPINAEASTGDVNVFVQPDSLSFATSDVTVQADVDVNVNATSDSLALATFAAAVTIAQTQDVLETAVITSSASAYATQDVLETAPITNPEPDYVVSYSVVDSAVITNPEPVQVLSEYVLETAPIVDTYYPSATKVRDALETAVITSAAFPSAVATIDVTETAVITSTATEAYPTTDITEAAIITSNVVYTTTGLYDVLDTAVITSSTDTLTSEEVTESAVITSTVTLSATSVIDITDSAVITSNEALVSNNVYDVLETATIVDTAYPRIDVITDVLEEGFISAYAVIDGDEVWTANTVNWAMSTYTGLTFTSSTDKYAVSSDGLFKVMPDDYADMDMATGAYDFGSPQMKSIRYAYVYAEHDLPMKVKVTADVSGEQRTFAYAQMARTADDMRAVRCTFGRGFRSSYYKLNFVSSGYAKVNNCLPAVTDLSRRI